MAARRPVLLSHPESARSPRLSFRQQAPRTSLESTLNTYKKHRGRRFHLLSIANPSLCFLTLTKCKFSNSFVLISIQNAGGVRVCVATRLDAASILAGEEERGMANFLEYNPEQAYLLPPTVREVLGEGHLCFFVHGAVEKLDLQE